MPLKEEILREFDALTHTEGSGLGDNEKFGQNYCGQSFPASEVSESGTTCAMMTLEATTASLPPPRTSGITPYCYTCNENTI